MKVCKFGGTSLADATQIRKVCDIVLADNDRRVVVVSAPGKRNKQDTKITDMLIACANARLSGKDGKHELAAVINRYAEIHKELGLPAGVISDITANLNKVLSADASHKARYMDAMKASGEDNSARLVAAEFVKRGKKARYLDPKDAGLLMTDEYGNAQLLPESYKNLSKIKDYDGITVFPGFFGYTTAGEVVTFPRGGSDITGSILAAAIGADVYENFTDVDSVFAVDPNIVPDAAPVREMTYHEMRELSYSGFSVLHEEAIIPTARAGIPICIKNTNNPSAHGTWIVAKRSHTPGEIVGIAGEDGFCAIYVDKYLMNREIGVGRKILQIVEEEGISFEHMPTGIDNISVVVKEKSLDQETEKRIVERLKKELNPDNVEVEHGLALITVVGEGFIFTPGMAARATKALSDAGINIEMMSLGASMINMIFAIKAAERKKAIASVYKAFFTSREV